MVVEIKKDIFDSNDFKGLSYLIQMLTYKQRYDLFIEWTLIKESSSYKRIDELDRLYIEDNYNKIITESIGVSYYVTIDDGLLKKQNHFNIEEAIRFFIQPVSVILENSLNDQYFIKAIVRCFDITGNVQKHIDNGWIQFENAGGCTNVGNFINGKLQSFQNLPKSNHNYLKCFVLLDSDKSYPTAPEKDEYQKLRNFFTSNNICCHFLEKRNMENYMPDEVFDIFSTNHVLKQWIDAYRYLSEPQKNFIDINNGFSKKKQENIPKKKVKKISRSQKTTSNNNTIARKDLDVNVHDLYKNISNSNFSILDKGFKLPNFKTEFPKNFDDPIIVYKKNLSERCGTTELQDILHKITQLL